MNIDLRKILFTWSEGKNGFVLPKRDEDAQISKFLDLFQTIELHARKQRPELTEKQLKDEVEEYVKFRRNTIFDHCSVREPRNRTGNAKWKTIMADRFDGALAIYNESETETFKREIVEKPKPPFYPTAQELVEEKTEKKPEVLSTERLPAAFNLPRIDTSNLPKLEVEYDPEIRKMLGFDDEQ